MGSKQISLYDRFRVMLRFRLSLLVYPASTNVHWIKTFWSRHQSRVRRLLIPSVFQELILKFSLIGVCFLSQVIFLGCYELVPMDRSMWFRHKYDRFLLGLVPGNTKSSYSLTCICFFSIPLSLQIGSRNSSYTPLYISFSPLCYFETSFALSQNLIASIFSFYFSLG